ncbi:MULTISPECIES: major capsid protein [unclassified Agrobacterium]
MPIELWTPQELYDLRRDDRMDDLPTYWLDEHFAGNEHYAEDGEIRFGDLEESTRFLAPFVLPYEQGKPIQFMEGESVEAFRVPYIKLKNAVRPEDAKNIKPSDVYRNNGQVPSIEERFEARVAELDRRHRRMIRMREAWMAARAIIDAKVQIDFERDQGAANPSVLLDFGRDPSLNVVKTADYWNDVDTPILDDIEEWLNRMYLIYGGGSGFRMTVGAQVAGVFRKNKQILDMLDTKYYGAPEEVSIKRGINRIARPRTYIGRLDSGLEVWSYKDTFDIPTVGGGKQRVDLFNEKDILIEAPGASGVKVRGPIYDTKAIQSGQVAADVFAKMWETEDPGERFIMHQASFLPVPLNPNRTLKARVLA